MEGTESTTAEDTAGKNDSPEVEQKVLMSSKPLHRFVQNEPRSLGIAILFFGCAELLMGFHLSFETIKTSCQIYVPFWQGFLFLICGNLSIYTEIHPSKRMVTVCLAMYIMSVFGIMFSVGYRIYCFSFYASYMYFKRNLSHNRLEQLFGVEGVLFISSLCVLVLLIFLCVIARLALKSTHTQVIVQHVLAPRSDTTSN